MARLEEAVKADAKKHDAHWWLGNAHTTQGFQATDAVKAGLLFDKAAECFRAAIKEVSLLFRSSASVAHTRGLGFDGGAAKSSFLALAYHQTGQLQGRGEAMHRLSFQALLE